MTSFIDKAIKTLRQDVDDKDGRRRKLLKMLQKDYQDEMTLAMELEAEAKHLPYEHLQEATKALAEKERSHAQKIEELIQGLGGVIDKKFIDEYQPMPDGQFSEMLRIENELEIRLAEHSNYAEDYGFRHESKVLRDIKNEHHDNVETIERIIMKFNGTI